MQRLVQGQDRAQSSLLPASLEDYVDTENPVRVIEACELGPSACTAWSHAARGQRKTARRKTGAPFAIYFVMEDTTRKPIAGAHKIQTQTHKPFISSSS